ncbi:MAG: hypothetical protein PHQ21_06970, partial [Firmicutes bacterium]|nr:hypothetical protein [Bacillota bacterium]
TGAGRKRQLSVTSYWPQRARWQEARKFGPFCAAAMYRRHVEKPGLSGNPLQHVADSARWPVVIYFL